MVKSYIQGVRTEGWRPKDRFAWGALCLRNTSFYRQKKQEKAKANAERASNIAHWSLVIDHREAKKARRLRPSNVEYWLSWIEKVSNIEVQGKKVQGKRLKRTRSALWIRHDLPREQENWAGKNDWNWESREKSFGFNVMAASSIAQNKAPNVAVLFYS